MRALRLTTLALLALAAALPGAAAGQVGAPDSTPDEPAPPLEVQAPTKRVLIQEGQDGRLLLGGRWYFRQDDTFVGEDEGWFASATWPAGSRCACRAAGTPPT